MFVQLVPQTVPPAGQTQAPLTQEAPVAQAFPQVPQLLVSVCVFVQLPPQRVPPDGHAQAPPTQLPEQQSAPTLHPAPGTAQATQEPLQMFEQHWLARLQAVPLSWQASQLLW
jgi:hypothetical protein